MDCIRIHTFVHMYVCLYVRASRRIQFAILCDKFAGSRVHLLSFSLSLWSLLGERKGVTAISPVIDWSSWRESRLRNSYRTSQLAFILVSFLVLFHKYFFYLIHRAWISSFGFVLTVAVAAAVAALSLPLLVVAAAFIDVSCAFIIHISHLILHFFLVSAPHSSMCPLKQLWYTHTHTHTNRQCSYSFNYFLDSVAPNPSDAAFNLSLCLHNPIVCLVWGDASLRKNIIIRFYISFMHFFSFSSLRC